MYGEPHSVQVATRAMAARGSRESEGQIGKTAVAAEKREGYKQCDVTPCIRLVASLIAQRPHFYPSRDVLGRVLRLLGHV